MTIRATILVLGLAGAVAPAGLGACARRTLTMDQDKLDARLRADLRDAEAAGDPGRTLPVLIVLAAAGGEGTPDLAARERRLTTAIDRLESMLERPGRRPPMKPLPLANAIAAELTVDQLRRVAADPAVKQLQSNRGDTVTTGPAA